MSIDDQLVIFDSWLDRYMQKGGADVPARLVVLMGFLERLRDYPARLDVDDHIEATGAGNQLINNNKFVKQSLERFDISSPLTEYGRKSSNIRGWIGPFLKLLMDSGFLALDVDNRLVALDKFGAIAARRLETINTSKPLIARFSKGTAISVITDILDQAQVKNRAKDVAEYLVGAKLQLRLGEDAARPKNVNTPSLERLADFPIGGAAIEVTVNAPDDRHVTQIDRILTNSTLEVWLLVRLAHRQRWQKAVESKFAERAGRVAVVCIETFVGQNISEIGAFERGRIVSGLTELFRIYNERWLPAAGSSGLKIVSGDPE